MNVGARAAGMCREIDFVRDAVFRMIEEVPPRSVSYVLTNALEQEPEAYVLCQRVERITVLMCDLEEQLRRIPGSSRTQRLKIDNVERARAYIESTTFFTSGEEDLLTIDTATMSLERAADSILGRSARRAVP